MHIEVAEGILEVVVVVGTSLSAQEEDFLSLEVGEGILEPVVDSWVGDILVYSLGVVQDILVLEEGILEQGTFAVVDNWVGGILAVEVDTLPLGILAYIL